MILSMHCNPGVTEVKTEKKIERKKKETPSVLDCRYCLCFFVEISLFKVLC